MFLNFQDEYQNNVNDDMSKENNKNNNIHLHSQIEKIELITAKDNTKDKPSPNILSRTDNKKVALQNSETIEILNQTIEKMSKHANKIIISKDKNALIETIQKTSEKLKSEIANKNPIDYTEFHIGYSLSNRTKCALCPNRITLVS